MQDPELLNKFIQERSTTAFTQIVQRYAGMVYGAALRQTRDDHLAEEITQAVFVDLWRKLDSLNSRTVLVGWLLIATRYRAANVIKLRRRREYHEQMAARMKEKRYGEDPAANNEAAAPYLDAALAKLSGRTRDALLLRFFEGYSMRVISERLGISEEAAKQRVSRGIDKLRRVLQVQGVALSVAAMSQILTAQAAVKPPAGLVQSAVAAAQTSLSKGAVITMAMSKAKIALVSASMVALLAGGTAIIWRSSPATAPRTVVIQPDTSTNGWQQNFNSTYSLAPGQQVKFIAPPYIPERQLFWNADQHKAGNVRPEPLDNGVHLTLESNNNEMRWRSMTFSNTLGQALQNTAGIKRADLDSSVPADLALPGDWVVRKGATPAQVAEGISAVISTKLGRQVRLERRPASRNTLVVRGTYHFAPLPGNPDNGVIDFIGIKPRMTMPSQLRDMRLGELLTEVANAEGLPLANETGRAGIKVKVLARPTYGPAASLLQNVAAQTSLEFRHEPRDTNLWFLTDEPATR